MKVALSFLIALIANKYVAQGCSVFDDEKLTDSCQVVYLDGYGRITEGYPRRNREFLFFKYMSENAQVYPMLAAGTDRRSIDCPNCLGDTLNGLVFFRTRRTNRLREERFYENGFLKWLKVYFRDGKTAESVCYVSPFDVIIKSYVGDKSVVTMHHRFDDGVWGVKRE